MAERRRTTRLISFVLCAALALVLSAAIIAFDMESAGAQETVHPYVTSAAMQQQDAETEVPADWSLTPSGLASGDQFRLVFLSSTTRNASPTGIRAYNTFIQNRAAAGHGDIQAYSSGFRVIGCTAATDARDNTSTTYTNSDKGVPIYWLGGAKVANSYEDFYDGSWDEEANDKNESGSNGPDTSLSTSYPFTGCDHDGTEAFYDGDSLALGNGSAVRAGWPNSSIGGQGPIGSNIAISQSDTQPFYGLSAVFQVAAEVTNSDPTFPSFTANRSVAENTAAGEDVGAVLTATGMDTLTYTLEGTDEASFDIVTTSGSAQIRTKTGVTYNHEVKSSYTVVVKADDNNGGTATVTVTITVTDVNEPPERPAVPTVTATAGSTTSLNVRWTAPINTGPDIDDYDLRYRAGSSGPWTSGPQNVTVTNAAIGSLDAGTAYEVQVRATNAEGDSTWSPAGTGTTTAEATPTVSISADKTSAVFKEDGITYTLTRSGSTTAALPVTLTQTQTKDFLAAAELSKTVTIAAGQSTMTFTVAASSFQQFAAGTQVEGGTLTAAVQDATAYDLGTPSSVDVSIVIGAMFRFEQASYSVGEAAGTLAFTVIARTGAGAPRPSSATSTAAVSSNNGSATKNTDFAFPDDALGFEPGAFSADGVRWKAEHTFTVSITNDALDEDNESFSLKLEYQAGHQNTPLVDASGNSCGAVCTATVTITDDDTAGVTVSESALTVTEEDATGDTYTVVLDRLPTANVTVTVGGLGSSDVTANPATLTFTTVNWNTAQTVTVTAANDADTTNDTVSLTHSAASSDAAYQGIAIAGVTVTVEDNHTARVTGVMITPGNAQLVVQWTAVANATGYEVQWKSGGQVYNSSRQATIGSGSTTSHTIPSLNNGTEYTVRVRAPRTGANSGTYSAEVLETPVMPTTAGVTVSESALTVTEQNATGDSYTVVLETQPTASVTVTVAGHAGTHVTPAPVTLSFTTLNWNTAQTVTVTAATDADTTNDAVSLTHSAASRDAAYQGIAIAGLTVTVADNDTAQVTGVMITPGNAQLVVQWTAVANATGYEVQWKSGGQVYNNSRRATIGSGSTTSHTISSLSNGAEYTVRVIATRTGANDGPPSAEAKATPAPIDVPIDAKASFERAPSAPAQTHEVPLDWSLIPFGLGVGDEFRLLFLSSAKRDASGNQIGPYNSFIQDLAAQGHADIQAYSSGFKVVGCTFNVDARVNTRTQSNRGVPIYWLSSQRVANDYADFYDGSWGHEGFDRNEFGADFGDTSQTTNYPFTGCLNDGTGVTDGTYRTLGAAAGFTRVGRLFSSDGGPIDGETNRDASFQGSFYGLSGVFHVGSTDATLSALSVADTGGAQLSPVFRSTRSGYALSVGEDVDWITVSPTPNHSDATYTIRRGGGATLADADPNLAGFQVGLHDDRVTIFSVKVRAQDTVATKTYEVVIVREPQVVPANWSLIPTGLTAGDEFRLLFLSSTKREGSDSHNIGTYDTFIRNRAAAGHADIQAYSSGFKVVGCTESTDAIDHTGTVYSGAAPGVPIYWLGGVKVVDDYEDFYDGSWDNEANNKNERGVTGLDTSLVENYPFTGCDHDGTESLPDREVFEFRTSLGFSFVTVGRPNSSADNAGPLSSDDLHNGADSRRPFYGLSRAFVVASVDDDLTGLELEHRDGAAIPLTPTFASGTTDYTVSLLNEVGVVTVIPTLSHEHATYEITDGRGTVLGDADPDADLFQVPLPNMANTINVVVTAQDDTHTQTYTVVVTRGPLFVPDTLSPLPTGVVRGDQLRLLFLSSTRRDGLSSSIADYNRFIRGTAAVGHSEIQAYSSSFRAVGCTQEVDARDNTETTYTGSNLGVPIYWINGIKVADNYRDFYDGSWDEEVNDKDETGGAGPDTSLNENYPLTGCDHDGTEEFHNGASRALGNGIGFGILVRVGRPNEPTSSRGPLSSDFVTSANNTRPMYGLSEVLEVVSGDATLIDLALKDDLNTDIPLTPAFASETTVYDARVKTSVTQVTIIPTVNESHATYEFRSIYSGRLLSDTNPNKNGFQRPFFNNNIFVDVVVRAEHRAITKTYRVKIIRGATPVLDVWSLTPPGLVADEEFRLLFLSSTTRDGASSVIEDYNTFISDLAAVGHDDIQAYSSGFRAVGCTADVNARGNTTTTYTSTETGVPVYWLGGAKAADDYEDFYDGSWDDEVNDKDESGANGPDTSQFANHPFTGCDDNGREAFNSTISAALGNPTGFVRVGSPGGNTGPISGTFNPSSTGTRPFYGLSEAFRVVSTDATLSDLAIKDNAGAAITLTPAFTSGTTDYTAFVMNSVDEVTVIPTVNEGNATYEIQDGSGTLLEDADPNEGDFQVALSEGPNTFKVEVAAQDEAYTQTYTVVITRTSPVTISADRMSAIYGEDGVDFTLTRRGSVDDDLVVTVNLTQTQAFLAAVSLSQTVVFAPGSATAELNIQNSQFRRLDAGTVAEKGALTATVADGAGYSVGTPNSAAVGIIIAATIGFGDLSYTVSEEAGSPLTFTVVVRTGEGAPQPDATITVGLGTFLTGSAASPEDYQTLSEDLDFSPSDFTADGSVYEARKSIDIPIIDDNIADSGETFLNRLQFAPGLLDKYWYNFVDSTGQRCGSTCVVTATITDTDPGVTVSKTELAVVEGNATGDSYTVVLNTRPTADVTVTVAGHAGTDVTPTPATLTFTSMTWATAQTVAVTAGEDRDMVHDTVSLTHSATSTDSDYDAVTIAGVVVTVIDNDAGPGVTVSKTALTVTEGDVTGDSYTVILNTQPTADVTVTVAGHAGTDVTPTPATLTFTSTTWATAQTVTVTAGEDLDEVDDRVWLSHSATSTDSDYDAITLAGVAVTVADNDRPVVTVWADMAEANGNLHRVMFDLPWPSYTVTRTGSGARTLTVDLNVPSNPYTSRSSFTVKIPQGARSAQLEFGGSYFNQASVAGTLTVEVVESAPYAAGPPASISITRTTPAITLEIESGTSFQVSEGAGTVTFTVVASTAAGLPAPSRGWETEPGFGLSWGLDTVPGSLEATAGSDYEELSGVLPVTGAWVANGDHFRHVSTYDLEILDDMIAEPEEGLSLSLGTSTLPLPWGSYLDLNCPDVSCLHTVTIVDDDTAQVMEVMITPGNEHLVVSWAAVDNATGYQVQWKSGVEDYNTGDRQATVASGATISHTISSLGNGTEYTVRVIATRTGANDGPPSAEVKGTPTAGSVTVTPTSLTIAEGGSDTYTVVLDTEPTGNVTVTIQDPADNTDVTADPASLTFTDQNWDTAQTVTVSAAEDDDGDDETATITHTVASTADPTYEGISASSVTVTVDDDETASTEVILTVDPEWADEGTALTNVRLTAALNEAPRAELTTVTVMVGDSGDSAVEGTDYETIGELTLNIRAGQTSTYQTIQFRPVNTGIGDGDKGISITGTTTAPGLTVTETELALLDDETTRSVTLTATPDSVAENGAPVTVVVRVMLDSDSYLVETPVTVTVGDPGDSATEGTDYTSVGDFTVTIEGGATAANGAFRFTPGDDSFGEGNETISVSGRSTGPSAVVQGTEVTIVDDETLSTEMALSVSPDNLGEGAGATTLTVTGTLNNDARSSPTSVTVMVGAASDAAVEGADYETVADFTLTIGAGQTTGTTTFQLIPTGDAVNEVDEALTVSGTTTADGLTVTSTTVTIEDDDPAGMTVSETALTVTEEDATGDGYTVVLDSQPAADVVVTVAGHAGTDVTANPATLTFTALNWETAQTVTVTAGADADAVDDTVTLSHSAASSDGDYQGIAIAGVTVTVEDNDTAQVMGVMVEPGNAQLVVQWTAVANATGYEVQWKSGGQSYNTGDRQATVASGSTTSHTIPSLSNGTEYTVRVRATRTGANDGAYSAEVLETPVMPTAAGVTVSESALTVTEEDSTGDTYTVVLDRLPTASVTVTVGGLGSSDVTANPATLTFTTGNWATAQMVTVTAGNDVETTNDTVSLTHSAASSDSTYQGITIAGVVVTVEDNDTAQVLGVMITPGNAQLAVQWTAVANATGYEVQWKSGGQSYNTSSRQAPISSGSTTSHTIPSLSNGTEYTVRVRATRTGANSGAYSAEVVETPELDVTVSYEQGTYTVAEGGSVTVKVKLDVDPERTVTIPITRVNQDGATTADYSGVPLTLTFTSGETEKDISFAATHDSDDDDGESVKLTFGTLPTGVTEGTTNEAVVSIIPRPEFRVRFALAVFRVIEGESESIRVTISPAASETIVIPITWVDEAGATPSDYFGVPGSISFSSGATQQSFTVTAVDDQDDDDNEWIRLGFGPLPAGVTSGTGNVAAVSIVDNDVPAVTVSYEQGTYTVAEGSSVTVKVKLSAAPERRVTIPITRVNQDGATTADYSGVPLTLTFNGGDTEKEISFAAATDSDDDDGESVKLTFGTLPTRVSEGTTEATTVTITDDDEAGVTVSETALTVTEEDATGDGYTVVLDSQPAADVVVTVAGHAGSEVSPNPVTLTFTALNWATAQTVTVTAGNDADAVDDTVTLSHSAASTDGDYQGITIDGVTVTVTDNETVSSGVVLSVNPAMLAEDGGAKLITITASLNHAPRNVATALSLSVGASGDTALEGTDYGTIGSLSLTIGAGASSAATTFTLTPTDDDRDEDNETLTVDGSVSGLSVTAATVTITDDDPAGVTVSETALTVTEEDSTGGSYTVVLDSQSAGNVVVTVAGHAGSEVSPNPVTLTFTALNWATAQTVTVTAGNDADAIDDTVTLSHSAASTDTGYQAIAIDGVTVTVTDDETVSSGVVLSVNPAMLAEDGGAKLITITASLNHAPRNVATALSLSVGASGDTALEGTDYGTIGSLSLTIGAGASSAATTFTLTPTNDDRDEDNETLTVDGSVSGLSVTATTVTITDDDEAGVTVSKATLTVTEEDSTGGELHGRPGQPAGGECRGDGGRARRQRGQPQPGRR